jgi:hypothetical protein
VLVVVVVVVVVGRDDLGVTGSLPTDFSLLVSRVVRGAGAVRGVGGVAVAMDRSLRFVRSGAGCAGGRR